ncbi:hypothetical protein BRADI_1g42312v3 [Brachypodium distachyon]|uniref:Uncharacterized protein n=1 Tax=Brachypodium distachyon TaxID=15368 RepID=A0A2K2DNW0_BRADI|nr:hypothetical protein BRADI_1g42312v3 [Brachypodium distachyon]
MRATRACRQDEQTRLVGLSRCERYSMLRFAAGRGRPVLVNLQ